MKHCGFWAAMDTFKDKITSTAWKRAALPLEGLAHVNAVKKMPKISIAMPVFNGERYVAQAIESLLGQTFDDFEFVISDNASTDGTEAICRHYAAADRRVRYVRRATNIGGPRNFGYAFSLCTGTYVKWTTADDYSDPRFLAEAVAVLDAEPDVVLCFPTTRVVDADGKPTADYDDNLDLRDESPRVAVPSGLCAYRAVQCAARSDAARRYVTHGLDG